jgi:hypothetical protein
MRTEISIDRSLASWDSAEGTNQTQIVLGPDRRTSMDREKDLIDAFETMVHEEFANPERIGCSGRDSLVRLASSLGNPEFVTILAHIRQCAPCFDELKKLCKSQGDTST